MKKNKTVLIVSPYFPPDNTADLHRIRQSLPYYQQNGWNVIVLCVEASETEAYKDRSLLETIPNDIEVHKVKALPVSWTRKIGLGNVAMRAFPYLYKTGNELIRDRKPDLVFISTTQFTAMVLGALWKKKWGIPYILDFQDPWHHDHYLKLPPNQRPPKYWFSYRMNKFLEPQAVRTADGLMAVSGSYIEMLKNRYQEIEHIPSAVIPFGAADSDISGRYANLLPEYFPAHAPQYIRIVYTGVINREMLPVIQLFLQSVSHLQKLDDTLFKKLKLYFIGTRYSKNQASKPVLQELALETNLTDKVVEITTREDFLTVLQIQKYADLLLLPGTTDDNYIASKLAPYLISQTPIFSIFKETSAAYPKLKSQPRVQLISFLENRTLTNLQSAASDLLYQTLISLSEISKRPIVHPELYQADYLTAMQTQLFEEVLKHHA